MPSTTTTSDTRATHEPPRAGHDARDDAHAPPATRPRARRGVALAVLALAALVVVGVIAQFVLTGLALFVDPLYWRPHHDVGHSLAPITLALLVLAILGRQPATVRWRAGVLLVLVIAQGALAAARGAAGVLHPVNALLVLGAALALLRSARAAWVTRTDSVQPMEDR